MSWETRVDKIISKTLCVKYCNIIIWQNVKIKCYMSHLMYEIVMCEWYVN